MARRACRGGVVHSRHRLSFAERERERILVGVARGESNAEIARVLGRDRSTIGRELARCGPRRGNYSALAVEGKAQTAYRRPKSLKLASHPPLLVEVGQRLREYCSPQQIAARLKREFPDDPEMRISHETIHRSLYLQAQDTVMIFERPVQRDHQRPAATPPQGVWTSPAAARPTWTNRRLPEPRPAERSTGWPRPRRCSKRSPLIEALGRAAEIGALVAM